MAELSVEDRIARIRALLDDMRQHSVAAREEILVATEQLLLDARQRHREAADAHRRGRNHQRRPAVSGSGLDRQLWVFLKLTRRAFTEEPRWLKITRTSTNERSAFEKR